MLKITFSATLLDGGVIKGDYMQDTNIYHKVLLLFHYF